MSHNVSPLLPPLTLNCGLSARLSPSYGSALARGGGGGGGGGGDNGGGGGGDSGGGGEDGGGGGGERAYDRRAPTCCEKKYCRVIKKMRTLNVDIGE